MHSIDAHCFFCGYDTLLMIGGLMSDHQTHSAGPVSCSVCQAITTANYQATTLTCQACKSSRVTRIDDPAVWLGDQMDAFGRDGTEPIGWLQKKELSLRGHYKCPKCQEFELRFGTNYAGHGHRRID